MTKAYGQKKPTTGGASQSWKRSQQSTLLAFAAIRFE